MTNDTTAAGGAKKVQLDEKIVGLMMIGCMTFSMVNFTTTLSVELAGSSNPFVLQDILDSICKGLIPLLLVLFSFRALRKKVSPNWVMLGLIAFGFLAVFIGLV